MVTREYKCEECGKQFEMQQSIKDGPLTKCKCGGKLKQCYGADIDVLWFTDPRRGAISNRFETKGVGCKNPWNIKRASR